jgi:uncharacterized protein (PEP-CTERM system associated)
LALVVAGLPGVAAAQAQPVAPAAPAQGWRVDPSVRMTAVATDNVSFSATGTRADVVVVTTPALKLQGKGPEYELNGSLAADALVYLGRTLGDRLFPQVAVDGKLQVLPRLLFLDADASAKTTPSNPFAPIGDGPTYLNRNKVTRFNISPHVERELSQLDRLSLRSSHAWSSGFGNDNAQLSNDAYVETQAALYERKPTPMGLRLAYDRQATDYTKAVDSHVEIRTARGALLYAPDPELTLGLIGGRDQGEYSSIQVSDTLRGASLRWAPSQRTLFDAVVEKRFFGSGWNATLTHRTPYMAFSGNVHRSVSTYASRQAQLTATSDVAALLDQMLTTRIPDAAARSTAVQDIMTKRGLPTTLGDPLEIYSETIQLVQGGNVSIAWMGPRNTVTLQYYAQRVRDLLAPQDVLTRSADAYQRGSSLGASHKVTATLTADVGVTYSRVIGEGVNTGRRTGNLVWRLGATETLSPRTTASAGLKRQLVTTDTPSVSLGGVDVPADSTHVRATSLSVGVMHRF